MITPKLLPGRHGFLDKARQSSIISRARSHREARPFCPIHSSDLKYGETMTLHCVYSGLLQGSLPSSFSTSKILGR